MDGAWSGDPYPDHRVTLVGRPTSMSRLARQRRRQRAHGKASRYVILVIGLMLVLALVAGGVGTAYVVHYANEAPPLNQLKAIVPGGNSEVFAADGTALGYIQSDILRSPIAYKDIPDNLKNATVAIEDQRYWQHGGVDIQGILRSAVKDALGR